MGLCRFVICSLHFGRIQAVNILSIYFVPYAIKWSSDDIFSISRLYLNLVSTTEKVQRFWRFHVNIHTRKSLDFNRKYEFSTKYNLSNTVVFNILNRKEHGKGLHRIFGKRFKFNICDLLRNIAFVSYSQNNSFRNGKGERAVANIKAGKSFFNKKYFGAKNSSLVPYSITKKTESFEYPKNNTHSSNACKNSNYYFPHTLTDIFNYFFCLILSLSTHLARSYLTASRCLRPMSTARRITSCLASPRFSHAKFMFLSVFSVNLTGVGATNFPLFSNIFIQKTVLNSYTKAN